MAKRPSKCLTASVLTSSSKESSSRPRMKANLLRKTENRKDGVRRATASASNHFKGSGELMIIGSTEQRGSSPIGSTSIIT